MPLPTKFNRITSGLDSLDRQDTGDVLLTQSVVVTTLSSGAASSASLNVPPGSQIVNLLVDKIVDEVVGSGTATAIPVTVGTVAAGTQYMSAVDLVAGGRANPTFTTAQLAAMGDVGNNTAIVITADPNGTILTTQAELRLTVVYAQKV